MAKKSHWIIEKLLLKTLPEICISIEKGKANTDLSQNGRLAVGVPGSVSGMFYTHQNSGNYRCQF